MTAVTGGTAIALIMNGYREGGVVALVSIASALAFIYFSMSTVQRLNYRMSIRANLRRDPERCRSCGERTLSPDYPFCSVEHQDKHASATAW